MKWEHKIIFGRRDVEILDQHGAEGWELAAVTLGMAYFKRPVPEPEDKPVETRSGGWRDAIGCSPAGPGEDSPEDSRSARFVTAR